MGKSVENLKGWFRSLRDTHTRLHKTKSGSGVPQFTEREEWIITKLFFLNLSFTACRMCEQSCAL